MEIKRFDLAEVKTVDNGQPGSFEAVVAVFGNVDAGGDRMMKGAFARTLKEAGMPPICWSHEWLVPPIGVATSAKETDEGLQIKGRLFVGADEDHAVAKQVYASMKAGALKEFSFGYAVKASTDVTEDGKTIRQIEDVDLFEAGPTLKGMNPATRLVGVKALERAVLNEVKAGRVLSKANESRLAEASQIITDVLAQVADEPKAITAQIGKAGTGAALPLKSTASPSSAPDGAQAADADKPDPKDAQVSEEEQARIAGLLTHRPIHIL